MCCKLLRHCSEVVPLVMRPTELVQCIEYGDNSYFVWILHLFFARTSLPSFFAFYYLVQVDYSTNLEECSLFGLLGRCASLWFLLGFSSTCWVTTSVWVGPSSPFLDLVHGFYSRLGSYPSHNEHRQRESIITRKKKLIKNFTTIDMTLLVVNKK